MESFATTDDYAALYGDAFDEDRVETILAYSSAYVADEMARGRRSVDPDDEVQALNLKRIVCRLSHDMYKTSDECSGIRQMTSTVGSFTDSWTYNAAYGNMSLTRAERKSLGIYGMRAGSVKPRRAVHDVP